MEMGVPCKIEYQFKNKVGIQATKVPKQEINDSIRA